MHGVKSEILILPSRRTRASRDHVNVGKYSVLGGACFGIHAHLSADVRAPGVRVVCVPRSRDEQMRKPMVRKA